MNSYYRLFGILVRTNCPAPGLTPTDDADEAGIEFEVIGAQSALVPMADAADWTPVKVARQGRGGPYLWRRATADGDDFRMRLSHAATGGILEFHIDAAAGRVQALWDRPVIAADLWQIWTAAVLPYLLRRRSLLCLHAAAVVVDGAVVALVGEKGAGKSTTALALVQRGALIFADDLTALTATDDAFITWAGPPRVNLWPDAADHLLGNSDALPRTVSVYEKRLAPIATPATDSAPLCGIFLLGRRSTTPASPVLERVPAHIALTSLAGSLSAAHFPPGRAQMQNEFALLGKLASQIPVWRLHRSDRIDELPQICALIESASTQAAESAPGRTSL